MPSTPPPVIVTTDLSSDAAIPTSAGSPVEPTQTTPPRQSASHLSPLAPPIGGSQGTTPPSPALTNSSVHFSEEAPHSPTPLSSLALRDNHPNADSGKDTLRVIGNNDPQRHNRMSSVGTWSSAGDAEKGLSNVRSTGDQTLVDKESADEKEGGKKGKKEKKKRGEFQSSRLDPETDTTDPTPFKEKPSRLAMMVDPKSLEELEKMGGTAGLLAGLGVDPKRGLSTTAAGAPRSGGDMGGSGPQWTADVEKRREIYGRNELPQRKSKSLFRLMWMAFQDKILVRFSITPLG